MNDREYRERMLDYELMMEGNRRAFVPGLVSAAVLSVLIIAIVVYIS
jgi:hypothetical protein